MPELTLAEIQRARARLEDEAALAIGRFIIEFCRLEMELGLAIAWKNGGEALEQETEHLKGEAFGVRLERFRRHIDGLPAEESEAAHSFRAWIKSAGEVRDVRNQFIHGRWGFHATSNEVSNVVGFPTADGQYEVHYKIADLNAQVQRVVDVCEQLSRLRSRWPWR